MAATFTACSFSVMWLLLPAACCCLVSFTVLLAVSFGLESFSAELCSHNDDDYGVFTSDGRTRLAGACLCSSGENGAIKEFI